MFFRDAQSPHHDRYVGVLDLVGEGHPPEIPVFLADVLPD
ncbi:hypothetical protein QE394_002459 [Arthrobacter sp. SORGH_AS 212]|nr:hypothetical protein [Arthrobacter sp. SORGH_AS_0212]